jgi:hypothetical protein
VLLIGTLEAIARRIERRYISFGVAEKSRRRAEKTGDGLTMGSRNQARWFPPDGAIEHKGDDLRDVPLIERKQRLAGYGARRTTQYGSTNISRTTSARMYLIMLAAWG